MRSESGGLHVDVHIAGRNDFKKLGITDRREINKKLNYLHAIADKAQETFKREKGTGKTGATATLLTYA